MRVLYVVFVLSILALIWTAIAVARHIRRHEARVEQHPENQLERESVAKSDPE
jgi:hypothetical protein